MPVQDNSPLFERFSDLDKLKRITVLCLTFSNNCKYIHNKSFGLISVNGLISSFNILIKLAQHEYYSYEITLLKNNIKLPSKINLIYITPFIDSFGILRVGGRLQNSQLNINI